MEQQSSAAMPELPVYSEKELEWYRLQATATVAHEMGVWDFVPRMEEDLRAAIRSKAPDLLGLLDAWYDSYREYCAAMRQQSSDQWDRRRNAETVRLKLIARVRAVRSAGPRSETRSV
ncbi:MAG TPA: hypothetical protein VKX45_03490 [Bryobacteraceae bacterium]|jgi:hypothetical protein|nr:hypothetical protein [Bryobacteraceae bacterium]